MKSKKIGGKLNKKPEESGDDCNCVLCKLMEDGDGGDYEKLKKGLSEMAMRANMNKNSGITVGIMPVNKKPLKKNK